MTQPYEVPLRRFKLIKGAADYAYVLGHYIRANATCVEVWKFILPVTFEDGSGRTTIKERCVAVVHHGMVVEVEPETEAPRAPRPTSPLLNL